MNAACCVVLELAKPNKLMNATGARNTWRLVIIVAVLLLNGCSGRIIPPKPPEIPRAVFVLDHGYHSSLVVEDKHGELARYSYGDWRYYAEGKTGIWSGLRAIFAPTKAGLGRKQLSGPATLQNIQKQLKVAVVEAVALQAEATAVDNLQHKLETIYLQNQHSRIYRKEFDLDFVPYPKPYSVWHNSNQVIAHWLTELGSEIHGWPLLSNWQI